MGKARGNLLLFRSATHATTFCLARGMLNSQKVGAHGEPWARHKPIFYWLSYSITRATTLCLVYGISNLNKLAGVAPVGKPQGHIIFHSATHATTICLARGMLNSKKSWLVSPAASRGQDTRQFIIGYPTLLRALQA